MSRELDVHAANFKLQKLSSRRGWGNRAVAEGRFASAGLDGSTEAAARHLSSGGAVRDRNPLQASGQPCRVRPFSSVYPDSQIHLVRAALTQPRRGSISSGSRAVSRALTRSIDMVTG